MSRAAAAGVLGLLAAVAMGACGSDAAEPAPTADAAVTAPEDDLDASEAGAEPDAKDRAPETGFVTSVVSFEPGACAGFHAEQMPGIVLGPPRGNGAQSGGLDVVSLGTGGTLVLAFDPIRIVDDAGPDFTVFENAFFAGGDPARPFLELAEVSVSADGDTWRTFPCGGDAGTTGCAGRTPVYSSPTNDVSSTDPAVSGGDAFDLADVGATAVRYVKLHDVGNQPCADAGPGTNGFDLDAIAVLHAGLP